jgi:CHAT domain-containing protein
VDFGAVLQKNSQVDQLAMSAPVSRDGSDWQFRPLDGTRAEVAVIDALFQQRFPKGQRNLLRQDHATKQAVCDAMPHYNYLHLATHGFFAPPELRSALAVHSNQADDTALNLSGRSAALDITGFHPDLLVGLALAGANQHAQLGQDDGILTALEVESLDLRQVDMVVLSACETGLGQTAGGEGVLGLQRAFQLAGAQATVCSLWSVDDAATQTMMTEFYTRLWDKEHPLGKLEALRQAQLQMLHHYDPRTKKLVDRGRGLEPDVVPTNASGPLSPKYWAAFQLSGDWR